MLGITTQLMFRILKRTDFDYGEKLGHEFVVMVSVDGGRPVRAGKSFHHWQTYVEALANADDQIRKINRHDSFEAKRGLDLPDCFHDLNPRGDV